MRAWVYDPKPQKVPRELKEKIEKKAERIITILKETHVKENPKDPTFNFITNIYCRWIGRRFYFCAKYNSPSPHALSESFESKFARLEYTGSTYSKRDKFQLFFMRHTGQWIKHLEDETLKNCFESIKTDPWFTP